MYDCIIRLNILQSTSLFGTRFLLPQKFGRLALRLILILILCLIVTTRRGVRNSVNALQCQSAIIMFDLKRDRRETGAALCAGIINGLLGGLHPGALGYNTVDFLSFAHCGDLLGCSLRFLRYHDPSLPPCAILCHARPYMYQ